MDSNQAICLQCTLFPPPRISQDVCHRPPVSESPGLLFSLQTHGLLPGPLNQNPQGQAQEPLFNMGFREIPPDRNALFTSPRDDLCSDVCRGRGWHTQGLAQSRTSSGKMSKLRHGLGPMKGGRADPQECVQTELSFQEN